YKVRIEAPGAAAAGIQRTRLNVLGLHLCPFMDRLALYDPATAALADDPDWHDSPKNGMFQKSYITGSSNLPSQMSSYTCVILHDGKGNAVGMMGAAPGDGPGGSGSVGYFLGYHWKQLGRGADDAEFSNNTIMMTAMNEAPLRSGADYVVYLLVGTLDEVAAYARDLYAARAGLDW
ncbi:MAG: hypothetical protein M1457_11405, partial [bacterium]|nr:hypothetical protein [bacterium]